MAEQEIKAVRRKTVVGGRVSIHGIEFERTGTCIPCEGCFDACVNKCPHGIDNGDGTPRCSIHNSKGEVCMPCSTEHTDEPEDGKEITHQVCIDYPSDPFLDVIRSGVCSYSFEPVDHNMSMVAVYALFDRRRAGDNK